MIKKKTFTSNMINGKIFVEINTNYVCGYYFLGLFASTLGQEIRQILEDEIKVFAPSYISIQLSSLNKTLASMGPLISRRKDNLPFVHIPYINAKLLRQGKRLVKNGGFTYIYCFPSELPIFLSNALIGCGFRPREVKGIIRTIITNNDYKTLCYTINKRQTVKIN